MKRILVCFGGISKVIIAFIELLHVELKKAKHTVKFLTYGRRFTFSFNKMLQKCVVFEDSYKKSNVFEGRKLQFNEFVNLY